MWSRAHDKHNARDVRSPAPQRRERHFKVRCDDTSELISTPASECHWLLGARQIPPDRNDQLPFVTRSVTTISHLIELTDWFHRCTREIDLWLSRLEIASQQNIYMRTRSYFFAPIGSFHWRGADLELRMRIQEWEFGSRKYFLTRSKSNIRYIRNNRDIGKN